MPNDKTFPIKRLTLRPVLASYGPYLIESDLGRGGGGVVSRARHRDTGELVALKTLHALHEDAFGSLRREIHALSLIRHPGIVRILGQGVEAGIPYYAMELLSGETLLEHCRKHWDPAGTARDLNAVLSILRRLCAPLAYLHGEGIVHRDLKPRNVLVRDGGVPVIVDFGLTLAATRGRERLVMGDHSGTAAFMAPEQLLGEVVDPRADLFSLGCMAFSLLTGTPPFPTLDAMLDADVPPPRVSTFLPEAPPALDDVVSRLLARDRASRTGHADDVAEALASLGASNGLHGPAPRAYVYRPSFVGREGLREALASHVKGSLGKGRPGIVLVGGESGIGKTRFLLEVAAEVTRAGHPIAAGECGGPEPLAAMRPLLLAILEGCRAAGSVETDRLLGGGGGKLLSLYEPALLAIDAVRGQPDPAPLNPKDAADRLWRTLDAAFAATPRLLMIDDLQWADELTLGYLGHMTEGPDVPLLVLASYRSEERTRGVEELAARPGVRHIELQRLDEPDVRRIVSGMLSVAAPPAPFVRSIARRSRGNPFFVAEYLRAAISAGLLFRELGAWRLPVEGDAAEALPLPQGLHDIIASRLARLSPTALRFVQAAAVAGVPSAEHEIGELGQLDAEPAMEAASEAAARQVLELDGTRLRFVHDQLREVAYAGLSPGERLDLHAREARRLEGALGPTGDHAARLADHWDRAGDGERALPCYLEAARHALRRHAHKEAERLFLAALALAPRPSVARGDILLELGTQIHGLQGRMDEATRSMEDALGEARQLGDRPLESRALLGLSRVSWLSGRLADALVHGEAAHDACSEEAGALHEAQVLGNLAIIRDYGGQLDAARALYDRAIGILRQLGERSLESSMLMNLGCSLRDAGRLEEAASTLQGARAGYASDGNVLSAARVAGNLALVRRDQGRSAEAEELLREAIAVHRACGSRRDLGRTLDNLGTVLHDVGQGAAARACLEEALVHERATRDRHYEGVTLGNLAMVEVAEDRPGDARGHLEAASAILLEVGDRIYACNVLCNLAMLARRTGRAAAEVEHVLARALATIEDASDPLLKVRWLCEKGHHALACGQDAAPWLESAETILRAAGTGAGSELSRAAARLRAACATAASGGALRNGETPGVPGDE